MKPSEQSLLCESYLSMRNRQSPLSRTLTATYLFAVVVERLRYYDYQLYTCHMADKDGKFLD